ncbi:MAG: DUF1924 domain-containing protein [Alphaproteobacteria bacterium]
MKTLVRVILQISVAVSVVAVAPVMAAEMSPPRKAIYEHYEAAAKSADPSFAGFSAERGKKFFHGTHTGGKPDIDSCTTCHTSTPTGLGPHGVTASAMNRTFSPGVLLPLINR